jgi:hypothetical protein
MEAYDPLEVGFTYFLRETGWDLILELKFVEKGYLLFGDA